MTAESRFLSTQTTDNIRPFYSTACRKQGHRGLEHERPDSALKGRQHQHLRRVRRCHADRSSMVQQPGGGSWQAEIGLSWH
ncbi:hypothetical protein F7725_027712 [Dissostichus mawsoni]|uniref:Uncharacterized protein n=1 Tax=Dissostichus mawsoni TaxID=36200 RepID=A0A7J5XDU3_DISMA|nr:hypothetical protein F7725_027712 [Dissostichus mawsoni]